MKCLDFRVFLGLLELLGHVAILIVLNYNLRASVPFNS